MQSQLLKLARIGSGRPGAEHNTMGQQFTESLHALVPSP